MSELSKRRTENTPPATLDEVLEAYAMSDEGPSVAALAEWVRRYPQFDEELTSLTAEWGLVTHLPDVQDPDEPDEETLVLRGMSVVLSILDQGRGATAPAEAGRPTPTTSGTDLPAIEARRIPPASPTRAEVPLARPRREGGQEDSDASTDSWAPVAERPVPIGGLLTEGARHRLTPDALADETGLSVPLLRKLDRRLIPADSIPHVVSERLASALRRDLPVILDYSRLEPRFAPRAEHRAGQAPTLPAKLEDFFDAVRADPELSEERRAALLALEAKRSRGERTEGEG
jgi:hypothetical protein